MGLIRKTTAWILILLGIMLGFIPAIGLFIGLPLILTGIFVYRKSKEKIPEYKLKNSENSFNANQNIPFLLKIKPLVRSKKHFWLLIILSSLLLAFVPKQLKYLIPALIIWLFLSYNKIKHLEWLDSGKKSNPARFYLFSRTINYSSGGVLAVILGFLVLTGFTGIIAENVGAINGYVIAKISLFLVVWIGILFIIFGFWSVRFSYRNPYKAMHNFKVLEPGQAVISKKGVINKTLKKEASN